MAISVHVRMYDTHFTSSTPAQLVNNLRSTVGNGFVEVELSENISRFSLEAVGRAALGYSFGPLAGHGTDYSRALKMFG